MPRVDPDTVARIIEETAHAEILPRFRRLEGGDVREKAPGDLVTVADEAAEVRLQQRLRDLLPGSVVIGEEAAAKDEAVFEYLASDAPVWIIDPVDGTGNFARGRDIFAVMVALVRRGETLASWIHMPVQGTTVQAEAGSGATQDGRRLRIAPTSRPADEMRGTLHASTFASKEMARQIDRRRQRVGQVRSLSCAGAEYLRLARGEIDFSLFTKLMPWDHAPGTLLVTEAGGQARLLDGRVYTPVLHDADGLLLAPDESSWRTLHTTLFGG